MAAWFVVALVALMLLSEFCAMSYCMCKAWKLPTVVHMNGEDKRIDDYYKITGRTSRPSSMVQASRHEAGAFENMSIIKRRLDIPDGVEVDLLIDEAQSLNAYTLGMETTAGGRHFICLSSTLFKTMSNGCIAAVIGHEMGHIKNRDVALKLYMGCFQAIVSIILFAPIYAICLVTAALCWVFSLIPFLEVLERCFLFLLSILTALLRFLERLVMYPAHLYELYVSRRCEYLADAAAAHSVGPNSISRALFLLDRRHEDAGRAHLLHQVTERMWIITSTHPPLKERIRAISNRTHTRKDDHSGTA